MVPSRRFCLHMRASKARAARAFPFRKGEPNRKPTLERGPGWEVRRSQVRSCEKLTSMATSREGGLGEKGTGRISHGEGQGEKVRQVQLV
jgi:hypothetical protein